MSLKNILGLMLASRMAGRGGRMGGLGTAAVLSGGLGRKAGLAGMAYLAYRAYQNRQSGGGAGTAGGGSRAGTSGSSGGIGGMIDSAIGKLTGQDSHDRSTQSAVQPTRQAGMGHATMGSTDAPAGDAAPDAALSESTAFLLLQGMVAAAWADGSMSQEERRRIMDQLDEADADEADRRLVEREISQPQPLDRLLEQIHDRETAEQFYLASRAAVDPTVGANSDYLATLETRLGLSEAEVREVESLTG